VAHVVARHHLGLAQAARSAEMRRLPAPAVSRPSEDCPGTGGVGRPHGPGASLLRL
jgi:hypothetical protein